MNQRKYLTKEEVMAMLDVALQDKHGVRNHCLIFMAFRHGLRISELLSVTLSDIDMMSKQIYIQRMKNGFSTIHPFDINEQEVIQQWITVRESYFTSRESDFLFLSDRSGSLSRKQAWQIIRKCGVNSELKVSSHPHMLRHACGYTLANEGADTRLIQDYLGHRNIRHTVRYTQGNSERFLGIMEMMKK
jgi:site-specific recombinase XerD